jgi:type I restriction enzyme R subunit
MTEVGVRRALAESLHHEVAAMNLDNFLVRPQRRLVEEYAKPEAWTLLTREAIGELGRGVAGLPAELDPQPEEAKRFDLLILNLQLCVLRSAPGFERLRDQVKEIAALLEEKSAIPMVRAQMALIEKQKRRVVFADFEDVMGPEDRVDLPGLAAGWDFEKFRAKAKVFLREHQDHAAIWKLRMNRTLTATDLAELERMLIDSGVGGPEQIDRAKQESHGLGLFVRSLVGLDRGAAKDALAAFLSGKTLGANQIEFTNLIVDHLTEHGVMPAALLYESPFTDITPQMPDGLFPSIQVDELVSLLSDVRARAVA